MVYLLLRVRCMSIRFVLRQFLLAAACLSLASHSAIAEAPSVTLSEGGAHTPFSSLSGKMLTQQSQRDWLDLRSQILSDFANRLNPEFKVPNELRARTEFWFDVYTRYGQTHHIIHHVRFPWIVFKVVDTSDLLTFGKGPLWLRRERGAKLANQEVEKIRRALKRLSARKVFTNLSPLERELFDKLMPLKGPRKKVFQLAAKNVRSQLGQKDFFEKGLANSTRYLLYMEEQFKGLDLPVELTRMPLVESSFNEQARSKVGASGIWQIMPQTGRSYMIVNDAIDERNSPLKATLAAGRLLRNYYRALETWPLAITAYNHGIGNIRKAIHKARSQELSQIIDRYHQGDFRFASSNFYTCFLAALHAEKYHELIFRNLLREPLQEVEVFQLASKTPASHLSKLTGLDSNKLLQYNLDLRQAFAKTKLIPKGFQLYLPPGYKDRLNQKIGIHEKKLRPSS